MKHASNVVQLHHDTHPEITDELMGSINGLSVNKLRAKYPHASNCHRNMRQRCNGKWNPHSHKFNDSKCHPHFAKFTDFLAIMGLPPTPSHTLDRIDPFLKEYSSENCRWADKPTQAANKTNTIIVTRSDGSTIFLPDLAKQQGITTNAMYKRKAAGWSDDELLQGYRNTLANTAKGGSVGTKADWIVLIRLEMHRANAEQLYMKHRKHYGNGLRWETRGECFYRGLVTQIHRLTEIIVEHIDDDGRVLSSAKKEEDQLNKLRAQLDYACQNWLKVRGVELRHPRQTSPSSGGALFNI